MQLAFVGRAGVVGFQPVTGEAVVVMGGFGLPEFQAFVNSVR